MKIDNKFNFAKFVNQCGYACKQVNEKGYQYGHTMCAWFVCNTYYKNGIRCMKRICPILEKK